MDKVNTISSRGTRREKKGVVLTTKMDKTVIVRVDSTYRHPLYKKIVTRGKKYYAHDESNSLQPGDEVLIKECRPLSKTKKWLVTNKIEGTN